MDPLAAAWDAFEREAYAEAEQLYRGVLAGPELTPEQHTQARFGLAYVWAFSGRHDEARAGFDALRREAAQRGDRRSEHQMLHQVGMVERLAGRWDAARVCFEAERRMIGALEPHPLAVSVNAYELGSVALHVGEVRGSRGWFDVALASARQSGDEVAVACALRGLGDWSQAHGTLDETRALWQAARAAFVRSGSHSAVSALDARLAVLEVGSRRP